MQVSAQAPHRPDSDEEPRKRLGCYFWGCLTSILLVVVITSATGFLAYRFLTGQVRQYTADAAAELPEVEYSDAELAQLQQRLQQFAQETSPEQSPGNPPPVEVNPETDHVVDRSPPSPADLVLSARDINALISRHPEMRGKVFVTIEDEQISGEVSVPMESIPGGEGRFFNASATFHVELNQGQLFVTVEDAYVKGKQAPQVILDALAGKNLAENINQDPRMKPKLARFESVSIIDGNVILRAKPAQSTNDAQNEPESTDTKRGDELETT